MRRPICVAAQMLSFAMRVVRAGRRARSRLGDAD